MQSASHTGLSPNIEAAKGNLKVGSLEAASNPEPDAGCNSFMNPGQGPPVHEVIKD